MAKIIRGFQPGGTSLGASGDKIGFYGNVAAKPAALTTQLTTVTIGTTKARLNLDYGWSTAELRWDGKAAVQASVSVAALLLRCFSRLSNLNLGCGP